MTATTDTTAPNYVLPPATAKPRAWTIADVPVAVVYGQPDESWPAYVSPCGDVAVHRVHGNQRECVVAVRVVSRFFRAKSGNAATCKRVAVAIAELFDAEPDVRTNTTAGGGIYLARIADIIQLASK